MNTMDINLPDVHAELGAIFALYEEALTRNPGWEVFGTGESDNLNWRGKSPAPASQDSDGSNPLTMPAGVTARSAGSLYGVESQLLTDAQLGGGLTHIHGIAYVDTSDTDRVQFLRFADYQMSETDYGTPTPTGRVLECENTWNVATPDHLDIFSTAPTQHPTTPVTQEPVQMASPSIAMFLLRKT